MGHTSDGTLGTFCAMCAARHTEAEWDTYPDGQRELFEVDVDQLEEPLRGSVGWHVTQLVAAGTPHPAAAAKAIRRRELALAEVCERYVEVIERMQQSGLGIAAMNLLNRLGPLRDELTRIAAARR